MIMETHAILQHYWWLIISVLGGILVFLLFVQGGQGLLFQIGKTPDTRTLLITTLGFKWSLTFTTLVTFGGAFFASFPLFYSTSFGGAFYVWMIILFLFILQAVGYEFYKKPDNFLGDTTYEWFLILNGIFGVLFLGVAVGTFFTGANFFVNRDAMTFLGGNLAISQWASPWKGLEAVADYRNVLLGISLVFLSRTLACQYFLNAVGSDDVQKISRKQLLYNAVPFVITFVAFVATLLVSSGYSYDPVNGAVFIEPYKFLFNLLAMPVILVTFLAGVVAVLFGIGYDLIGGKSKGIWFSGAGTVVAVTSLLLTAGWNNTCYYPSLVSMQDSLNIRNSSSSEVTLMTMSYVSLLIPFVFSYIFYAWRQMNKTKVTLKDAHY